jgi:Acetyltransferase (GNAT) domain
MGALSAELTIRPYHDTLRATWDTFVQGSKNGTFLFVRDYMDYHCDRFQDCSLLVFRDAELVALFPANRSGTEVHSHQGLTYGGVLSSERMTTPLMLDVFAVIIEHLRAADCRNLFYKTIPAIYHSLPAEEDRYALFLADAALHRRDVLSVVQAPAAIVPQVRRSRGAVKATKLGVTVSQSDDWTGYWALLSDHLMQRFGVPPVHSLVEIERLRRCFPDNIRLHVASLDEEIVAGTVVFESARVAHVQYVASSERGRDMGALDKLFLHLLEDTYGAKAFFDFGSSNENDGRVLNRGLVEQKEGFGARAIAHDFYRLEL